MLSTPRNRAEPLGRCRCGSENVRVQIQNGQHYAALICADCGRHQRWLPKPGNEKVRRPAAHRALVQKYSPGYCELCLRTEAALPANQVLEAHHIREYQDDGPADRTNIWIVCTACHKLIDWVRAWVAGRGQGQHADGDRDL